jgi:hypothetical protein
MLALVALWIGWVQPASATSYIGISFTTDGTDCTGTIPAFTQFTFYVLVYVGPEHVDPGISGAEFRVDNFPAAWIVNATPNPASNASIGNPLSGGCNIAFPTCQTGDANRLVLLYTIAGFATTQVNEVLLQVEHKDPPSNPNFDLCPTLILCYPPVFTVICAQGLTATINSNICACCPAIEPSTWTRVKSMY